MHKLLPIGLTALCLGLTGCSASNCDVEVYLDPTLKTSYGQVPTLEVDIAGVNAEQAQRLQNVKLDQYFTPGSPQRKSLAPLTLHFSEENLGPMILDSGDKLWELWEDRGAQFIAVICNLPEFLSLADDDDNQASPNQSGAFAGPMAEMANENSAVFNNGRVLLINMHDGFFKDSSEHLVQISMDGLLTLKSRPEDYLKKPQAKKNQIRTVQDLKKLELQQRNQELFELETLEQSDAAQIVETVSSKGQQIKETLGAKETLGDPRSNLPAVVSFPQAQ